MKLKDFAEMVNGQVLGDPDIEISGVSGIQEAREGDITFLASQKLLKDLRTSRASAAIVGSAIEGLEMPQVRVASPYRAFAAAISCFHPQPVQKPLPGPASISDTARLGENVTIHPFVSVADGAVIGDNTVIFPGAFIGPEVKVGNNCVVHANVTIREKCVLGDRVIVHAGTVIGSDGFGYVFDEGVHHKIPQVGRVVIEDDVEIGSNVSIDRGTLGDTLIGRGTKIDNLVQIAHNVTIGEYSLLVAQVGISGSCRLGSHVTLAGQVGVADHSVIESGTVIGGKAGVMGGRTTKGFYLGTPIAPHREFMKAQAFFLRLPDMNKKIRELEARINHLEKEEKENDTDQ
ncbi:MAG: UDP-3-O-(3-hydroxymyristoyl)glucosamine N-acyltransferase [Thermodesulfovibrio sp.]|nr:UDP-3-O-(3-hydroxymyristoyl)glucosamine N-acyltransferase [Thermodesulfovibrio sp.]